MSDNINDGGPAFATTATATSITRREDGVSVLTNYGSHPGMTLRDYFAAAALQGLLSGYLHRAKLDNDGALMIPESIYETAYQSADAMLKAKEAKP